MVSIFHVRNLILLLVFFITIWMIYTYLHASKYGDILDNIKVMEVPHSVKCFFGENTCEQGDIDGWSMLQAFLYFIVGLIIPNRYLLIIIISIVVEIIKPLFGITPKYIISPLLNVTGYILGSSLNPIGKNYNLSEKYKLLTK
ncbi:hypothetical protein QJ854_gp344 [Moumouvirus goulette]|uniref:Uncharacterized protein n=1 Tax=Moumouvirus goulette TaxID=1247379 RepID=M1PH98_9VIRU|nr:hypothetical protein QJ854_gp344 [Moumouvirus goulette]AGF85438.1 hypothetical protein glt_00629 [Moumouvirus goulette]